MLSIRNKDQHWSIFCHQCHGCIHPFGSDKLPISNLQNKKLIIQSDIQYVNMVCYTLYVYCMFQIGGFFCFNIQVVFNCLYRAVGPMLQMNVPGYSGLFIFSKRNLRVEGFRPGRLRVFFIRRIVCFRFIFNCFSSFLISFFTSSASSLFPDDS